jgi:predicted nucleotidyltransferase
MATTHPEIEEVWLFGSLARGEALPGSDADLLVVLSDSPDTFLNRAVRYLPEFCGVGVDVFAYTRAELADMLEAGHGVLAQARAEGICLYRRPETPHETT